MRSCRFFYKQSSNRNHFWLIHLLNHFSFQSVRAPNQIISVENLQDESTPIDNSLSEQIKILFPLTFSIANTDDWSTMVSVPRDIDILRSNSHSDSGVEILMLKFLSKLTVVSTLSSGIFISANLSFKTFKIHTLKSRITESASRYVT